MYSKTKRDLRIYFLRNTVRDSLWLTIAIVNFNYPDSIV